MPSELSQSEIESVIEALDGEASLSLLFGPPSGGESLAAVPAQWLPLLEQGANRIQVALELWKPLRATMPATLAQLRRCLADVAVALCADKPASLIYFFRQDDEVMGQRGYAPANVDAFSEVPEAITSIVSPFYQVHDGWIDLFASDGGPLPVSQWRMSRDVDEGGRNSFLTVFSNGTEAVGFDLLAAGFPVYALWPGDDEVEAIDDFWKFIDEQVAGSLEDCDG